MTNFNFSHSILPNGKITEQKQKRNHTWCLNSEILVVCLLIVGSARYGENCISNTMPQEQEELL
jgi:hypothetical protein